MLKRILPFLIVILIAAPIVLFIYLTRDKTLDIYSPTPIELVPEDPALILESRSTTDLIKTVIQSAPLYPAMQKVKGLESLHQGLIRLDSLLNADVDYAEFMSKSPMLLSVHPSAKDQYDFVVILELQGGFRPAHFEKLMAGIGGAAGTWGTVEYDKEKLRTLTFGDQAEIPGLFLFETKKHLVFSPSQLLIENVVRLIESGNPLIEDPALQEAMQSVGLQNKAVAYVHLSHLPAWWAQWMDNELAQRMKSYNRYGSWAELDLTIRNDGLLLSGMGLSDDDVPTFLDVFRHQDPQPVEIDRIIPSSTGLFIHYGIEKPEPFFADLADYLGSTESGKERDRFMETANGLAGENVLLSLASMMSRDLALFYLPGPDGGSEHPVAIIGFQSRNQVSAKLMEWLDLRAQKEQKDLSAYRYTYELDEEKSFTLYRMPVDHLPEILAGPLFSVVQGNYFGFVGNNLVLADSRDRIEEVIYHFELNKTLSTDPLYQSSTDLIGSRSSFTCFAIPRRIPGLMQHLLKESFDSWVKENEAFLNEVGGIGMQFHYRDHFYHSLFIRFTEMELARPQTVWESRLAAASDMKPVFFTNHNTQATEIVLQDKLNNLYLINSAGRVLWRLPLDEKINSEIFEVDVYKNNKYQLYFSTENHLHLIDRNGNYVSKYPVKLRAPATAGVALFDYDANKDYRMLIPCSDHQVYLYDRNGDLIRGWQFEGTEGTVRQPARHFRSGTRDYIAFADEMRVYLLNRRGSVRVQPDNQFPVSPNNPVSFDAGSGNRQPRFVITDMEGAVYSINLEGAVQSLQIRTFTYNHLFTLADLNLDGADDYIFLDEKRMEVYRHDGTLLFDHRFNGNPTYPANIYRFSSSVIKLGVTVAEENDIYLFNADGTLHKGFPMRGQTPFTIGFLEPSASHFNLIVGSADQFLYNYRVK